MRCEAGDYDTAASVLTEFDFNYLLLWGHYHLMIQLHLNIKDNLTDKRLIMTNMNGLGLAHAQIGNAQESIPYFEIGLQTAREEKDRGWESPFLGNLGNRYAELGDVHKAIDLYEDALVIAREVGDKFNQGNWLCSLGNCDADLGDAHKSIEFYEQGSVIFRETSNKNSEFISLENLGNSFLSLNEHKKSQENYQQAIQIADEISFSLEQQVARNGLAETFLLQNDLVNARATIEAALQYDVPENNHNVTALHGIIALRQGERETAGEAFTKSIAQADEILAKTPEYYDALDAKGLALAGLVVSGEWKVGSEREHDDILVEAVETFRKAREIAPHAGVVKSVLRLFDELAKCDTEGVLKDVRKAVEGS